MWYFNSEIIRHPKAMVISNVTYPRTIFHDSDMLTSLGIKPYSSVIPDSRYYWMGSLTIDESGAEVVGTNAAIDKDIDELKSVMLDVINEEVSAKQGAIDWYWVRADKGGTAEPANIATYATTIYSEQATKESAVNAMTTIAEIITYENKPHTEVRNISTYNEDGSFKEYSGTKSFAIDINMLKHWTANPTDEVDPEFVSLTED